jgi:hypothetical protein
MQVRQSLRDNLVFRMRAPAMSRERARRMLDTYLMGRESSTLRSYQSSFRKLMGICQSINRSVFGLTEAARCEVWVECRRLEVSASGIKGISAVMSLILEVMGQEERISGRERVLKRSVIKASNMVKKKARRKEGTVEEVLCLVKEAKRTGSKSDYRVAMMAAICFFGIRRLADIQHVRVNDVVRCEDHLDIYLSRHKTDVEAEGAYFTLVKSGRRFNLDRFLDRYIRVMGISGDDALFPIELGKGSKRRAVTYNVMYASLVAMKTRLGMDKSLTWHSFRIGAATRGTLLGVRRNVIKRAGLWRSDAVDTYCRETNPGVILSLALTNDME